MNLLLIGSGSFIAQDFIRHTFDKYVTGLSKSHTRNSCEIEIPDFKEIDEIHFSNADVLLNFAALVHHPEIKDPFQYDEINHHLTIINARKAKRAGIKFFIQLSTVAVYGNASEISVNTPYNPLSPYGYSKLQADEELLAMQDHSFKVAIVRPPMVYGGGKAPGNMMRLVRLADKNIPLPFKGIDNKRDFINVHNLIQYLNIIAEKQLDGIHLITDHEPVSTEYLLTTIYEYLGKKNNLFKPPDFSLNVLKKMRPNEFNKLYGPLHIETNFPYEDLIQRYTVADGIREMVEWYTNSQISQPISQLV